MESKKKRSHFKINKNGDDDNTTQQKIQTSTNDIKMWRVHKKIQWRRQTYYSGFRVERAKAVLLSWWCPSTINYASISVNRDCTTETLNFDAIIFQLNLKSQAQRNILAALSHLSSSHVCAVCLACAWRFIMIFS